MRENKQPPIHLEIQKHRKNCYGLLRTSYRENGKVCHTTHGRLIGLSYENLKLIQSALRGEVVPLNSKDAPQTKHSKEYGASYAILKLAKELELDKIIYSKVSTQWVKDCLAMIVGRVIYAGSKLSLTNRYKDTALWELCGVDGPVDVEKHCYESMDYLLQRQQAIQKQLAFKNFANNCLILYDITSSYFEGEYEDSELITFGYNRDQKRGHEQIVIGLICTEEGCPVAVEVFKGNTKDESTVCAKVTEIKERYNVKRLTFVGDRGMLTQCNIEKMKGTDGLNVISALTHHQIKDLLEREIIKPTMFKEATITEITEPKESEKRYCLCYNNDSATRETNTRSELLNKAQLALGKIATSKKKSTVEEISARVGKVLAKTKMGKFIKWEIKDKKLQWSFMEDKIDAEKSLDGCYVIFSDIPKEKLNTKELVASYKKLSLVEMAFRNLKTVQLEIRPVYHKNDDRIRCHVFLCMLAYYIQWHISQKLRPLFEKNGENKKRFWTFENVIERLKSIRREELHTAGTVCKIITRPDEDQSQILSLLGVKL